MNLTVGGSSIQIVRDVGTPNAVSNFIATGKVTGPRLSVALPFYFIFSAAQKSINLQKFTASANIFWVKISGVWKQAVAYIKIAGVWKTATPYVNVAGIWK
jgi:hypothetical protein